MVMKPTKAYNLILYRVRCLHVLATLVAIVREAHYKRYITKLFEQNLTFVHWFNTFS